jgi:hypothetical protein
MINELIHSVCADGQPYSIVVAFNHWQLKRLFKIVSDKLLFDKLYKYFHPNYKIITIYPRAIYVDGCEILFFTKQEFEGDRVRGIEISKYGIFEDHLAAGEE